MHEATRTFCCRAVFVLCCALPTIFVGAWIGVRRSSAYAASQKHAWQTTLSQKLGLSARIERVEEPRPGNYVLHGVTLIDPDAPQNHPPLATASRVQLVSSSKGLFILGAESEITSENLPRLWQILHERLVRGPEVAAAPVYISLASLNLTATQKERSLAMTDVRVHLLSTATTARAAIEFRQAGQTGEPARLGVERNRATHPVATRWNLNTGGTPLPCAALAPCWPELLTLGEGCTFHGYVTAETNDTAWQAAAAGRFAAVNLEALIPQQPISGQAEVEISQALWRDGRLVTAAGRLRAERGTIGQTAWQAAVDALRLHVDPRLDQGVDYLLRYKELAIGFELNDRSLRVAGQCSEAPADTLLTDDYGPVVTGSGAIPLEPVALVHFLVPDSSSQVPAVSEVRQIMHWMPLPSTRR